MSDRIKVKIEDNDLLKELFNDISLYCEDIMIDDQNAENKIVYNPEDVELIEADPDNMNYLVNLIMEQVCCRRTTAIKKLRECNYDLVKTLTQL